MTLDEQLCALCAQHDLTSITITILRGLGDTWPQVAVQWLDDTQTHGQGIATSDHRVIKEGIAQALDRMNAKRRAPVVVPALEAA